MSTTQIPAAAPPGSSGKRKRGIKFWSLLSVSVTGGLLVSLVGIGLAVSPPPTAHGPHLPVYIAAAAVPATTSPSIYIPDAVTVAKTAAAAKARAQAAAAAAAKARAAAAAKAAAAQAYAHRVLMTMSGQGIQNSPPFLVAASPVTATYTYDCSGFGFSGNFIADMVSGDLASLGSDYQPIANALGMGGTVTTTLYPVNTGSSYHVSVNSECSWTVTVNADG